MAVNDRHMSYGPVVWIFLALLIVSTGCGKKEEVVEKTVSRALRLQSLPAGHEITALEIGMTVDATKEVIKNLPGFAAGEFPTGDVVILENAKAGTSRPEKIALEFTEGKLVRVRITYRTRSSVSREKLYLDIKKEMVKKFPGIKETERPGTDPILRGLFIWDGNIIVQIDETGPQTVEAKLYMSSRNPSPGSAASASTADSQLKGADVVLAFRLGITEDQIRDIVAALPNFAPEQFPAGRNIHIVRSKNFASTCPARIDLELSRGRLTRVELRYQEKTTPERGNVFDLFQATLADHYTDIQASSKSHGRVLNRSLTMSENGMMIQVHERGKTDIKIIIFRP